VNEIRVALAGVGSCASSLTQAVSMAREGGPMPGVMFDRIGPYGLADIRFVTAFEVDAGKIGLDLAEAIGTAPTVAKMHTHVDSVGTAVEAGPLLDGIEGNLVGVIKPHPDSLDLPIERVTERLRETRADVLVCLLPTGSTRAVQSYARSAALAGVSFVNATPEPVAHDVDLVKLFSEKNVALLGDDLRSHLGATTLHTSLIELIQSRGLQIRNTYQLNVGGNTDFLNLADPERAVSKRASKRNALQAAGIDARNVAAGPNGFVEYLGDTKDCIIRIEASSMIGSALTLDVRLQVEDSPNAAGVLVSAIRLAKVAADRKQGGVIDEVCPMLFKSPRRGARESEGLQMLTDYVQKVAEIA
jgi:myo-inositol-1-phosphate synthase